MPSAAGAAGRAELTDRALPVILIFNYRYQTELNVLAENLLSLTGGGMVCWGGIYLWRPADALVHATRRVRYPRLCGCVGVVVGIAMTIYGAATLNGDFVQRRETVAGVVTNKSGHKELRFGKSFYLDMDGRRFPTTAEVCAATEPSSRVRATVGGGTGTVFTATN